MSRSGRAPQGLGRGPPRRPWRRRLATAGRVLWGPRPQVIVAGNQKSGTSAIAALLASATGHRVGMDIPATWPPTINDMIHGRTTLRSVRRRSPAAFRHGVLKEPNLVFVHDQVRAMYPRARHLFVVRDPRDNIRSLLDRMGVACDVAGTPPGDRLPAGWRTLFDGPAWGLPAGDAVEVLAERWNHAADVYLQRPESFQLIRYEDFCADKKASIEALAARWSMAVTNDISGQVDHAFQPRGASRGEAWDRLYGDNLRTIMDRCGERMRAFRYL